MMDDFMNFMGCRNMVIEGKIEDFLANVRRGESKISVDCEELIDDKIECLQRETQHRLKRLKL